MGSLVCPPLPTLLPSPPLVAFKGTLALGRAGSESVGLGDGDTQGACSRLQRESSAPTRPGLGVERTEAFAAWVMDGF